MHIDCYRSYSELAEHEVEGKDFTITVFRRPFSAVAVVAPHRRIKGVGIEFL